MFAPLIFTPLNYVSRVHSTCVTVIFFFQRRHRVPGIFCEWNRSWAQWPHWCTGRRTHEHQLPCFQGCPKTKIGYQLRPQRCYKWISRGKESLWTIHVERDFVSCLYYTFEIWPKEKQKVSGITYVTASTNSIAF